MTQENCSGFNVSKWYFLKYQMCQKGRFSQSRSYNNIISYSFHFYSCLKQLYISNKTGIFGYNNGCGMQKWGQVYEYLYLSTFKYTFDSICILLKYYLIPAGALVLIPKYHTEYVYVLILTL